MGALSGGQGQVDSAGNGSLYIDQEFSILLYLTHLPGFHITCIVSFSFQIARYPIALAH